MLESTSGGPFELRTSNLPGRSADLSVFLVKSPNGPNIEVLGAGHSNMRYGTVPLAFCLNRTALCADKTSSKTTDLTRTTTPTQRYKWTQLARQQPPTQPPATSPPNNLHLIDK